jgi:hypothetical protein
MNKVPAASYELCDPRPIAAGAPYTFFLPSQAELEALAPPDLVKLLFDYPHETEKWAAERMWVKLEKVDGEHLHGTLQNVPDEPTSPLSLGDAVTFRHHHILAIQWEHPDTAPPPASYREYWERCLVDACVVDGLEPVEFLYREKPEKERSRDTYPDSGWRIRGRRGSSSDTDMDARSSSYVALGLVLNRDDSWLRWIDAPVGTALMRNFETGDYELESAPPPARSQRRPAAGFLAGMIEKLPFRRS